jgi:hypothetical protein
MNVTRPTYETKQGKNERIKKNFKGKELSSTKQKWNKKREETFSHKLSVTFFR